MTSLILSTIEHGSPEYGAAVELRYRTLREPLGLTFSEEELAAEADSIHITCSVLDNLAGCLVLKPQGDDAMQMRQVAVFESMRGKGIGKAMVDFSERVAREFMGKASGNLQGDAGGQVVRKIWLHARENAVPFYEKLGYQIDGEMFEEVGIPHWFMFKTL